MMRMIGPLIAVALASTGASAQTPPDDGTPSIVVTGQRTDEERIRDFVEALAPPTRPNEQLARFEHSVCPAALGFSASQRAAIEARIRAVAQAADIEVGRPNCRPNALVMVADDKNAFLRVVLRRHRQLMGNLSQSEIDRLLAQPGAAVAWYAQGQVSASGQPFYSAGSNVAVNYTSTSGSRITAAARPYVHAAALVVEADALVGLSTTQLADYAAMRLLGRADPARLGAGSPPTILAALEAPPEAEVPVTLTAWDLAFLRGLYDAPENLYAPAQRSAIGRRIGEEVGAGGDAR